MSILIEASYEVEEITNVTVYARYREHFGSTHITEIFSEIRTTFKNTKRSHYRQHAQTPLDHRKEITRDTVAHAYRYFVERQPGGYISSYTKGTADRPLCLPTDNEKRYLELLADYILAEDHVKGLSLKEKPRILPLDDEVYPPLGEGAQRFLEMDDLTPDQVRRTRKCEICESEFIDESRRRNAKVCGDNCREWKDAVRKLKERNNGDGRLKRYRERQDHEYPFYSPRELFEISERGETIRDDVDEVVTRAKLKQERGVRTPTDITMDFDGVHSPNNYKRWRSEEDANSLSGPVIIKRKSPEVIARYLRMYYGI